MANGGIVPWVRAADPAANFMEAYRAGAGVSEARARLNMQAEQEAIAAQARQNEFERQSAMQSQKLEMDRQLRLATMGLQQQRLETAQQVANTRAQTAARQYAAQQAYQKAIEGGVDPSKALMMYGPGMGSMASAMAAAERVAAKTTPVMPKSIEATPVMYKGKEVPGLINTPTPTGYRTMPIPGFVGEEAGARQTKHYAVQNRLSVLNADRAEILKGWGGQLPANAPKAEARAKQWQADKRRLDEINAERQQIAPKIGAPEVPAGLAAGGAKGPYTGQVVRGYVFLGGDPSKKENWQKQTEPADDEEEDAAD